MPACLVVDVAVREDGVEVFDALLGAPVVVVLKALKGRRVKKYPQWYNSIISIPFGVFAKTKY